MDGKIDHFYEGDYGLSAAHSIDSSPGQDGGPL